jgi:hypothetical protein
MAIRTKSSVTYVTDRGIELEVPEMETTHLVNAIGHHMKQLDTLRRAISDFMPYDKKEDGFFLDRRCESLSSTITILTLELAKRDPNLDYAESKKVTNFGKGGYGNEW